MEKQNNHIDRRGFLKIVGISAATTTAALYGCGSGTKSSQGRNASSPVPTDQMTYRSVGGIKDKVSLLGYGCMRWPTVPSPEGKGDLINQEAVNELVDYAIAHGVNYFDTSPVYVQGWSEKATGIALKRHPREKLYIATKLSNFSNFSRENSLAMYHQSFKDMQVEYFDYYLLHANRTVAEKVGRVPKNKKPKVLPYRIHDLPDPEKLENLSQFIARWTADSTADTRN